MTKISFVVLTKNEESNLQRCLGSIEKKADEIIVIDDFSKDKTIEIAKIFHAQVIKNLNGMNFAASRNLGMQKASNDWIFFIDADEKLVGEIGDISESVTGGAKAFKLKRIDNMWRKEIEHGEQGFWCQIRLVKKNSGQWTGKIHETFQTIKKVAILNRCFLEHYPHQELKNFISEINNYSDLRAVELFEKKEKSSILKIIFYPLAKFVKNYFYLLGILDGTRGFILAALMSFYSFLVRSKLYMLDKQKKG